MWIILPILWVKLYTMQYYTYSHTRLDNNTIFYIGKGTKQEKGNVYKRAYTKSSRNIHWKRIVAKTAYKVDILQEFENEEDSLLEETKLIKQYGFLYNSTGTLCNMIESDEQRRYEARIKMNDGRKIKTYQYNLSGDFIKEFNSITEASIATGSLIADIAQAVKGRRHTIGGFQWRDIKLDKISAFSIENYNYSKYIEQYDLEGNFIREWNTIAQIERETGFNGSSISNNIHGDNKTAGGFKWKIKKKTDEYLAIKREEK